MEKRSRKQVGDQTERGQQMFGRKKQWERLNQMLDDAIKGEFQESRYDETELSKLESKWKQFLENSTAARGNMEREKENIKSLISDISHQTKTPIANLKLYEELLEERMIEQEQAEELELLLQIKNQTEKLEFLIRFLTKMSRLESNILTMHPVSETVGALLVSVQRAIEGKAKEKGIKVRIDLQEDFTLLYDAKWTEEALYNIVDNAVKYSPAKSEIIVRAKKYEMYGAIFVKDEGMGIPEGEIPKIFQRFYRSETVSRAEGVGIGLYLAREIIRKQNGYIKVKSEVGKGSEFAVFLPSGQGVGGNLTKLLDS